MNYFDPGLDVLSRLDTLKTREVTEPTSWTDYTVWRRVALKG